MTLQVAVRRQGLDQIAEHIVQVRALLALDGADIEARETQTTGDFAYQFQLGHQSIDRRNRQLALVQQLVIRFDCIHIVVGGARSIALRGQAQRHQRLLSQRRRWWRQEALPGIRYTFRSTGSAAPDPGALPGYLAAGVSGGR